MLVFLLTALTGKISINLCSKSVHNLKSDYLHKILLSWLEKVKGWNFEMTPTMFDGTPINVKVARMLPKALSEKFEGNLTLISELKLDASFSHDSDRYFILFYIFLK